MSIRKYLYKYIFILKSCVILVASDEDLENFLGDLVGDVFENVEDKVLNLFRHKLPVLEGNILNKNTFIQYKELFASKILKREGKSL